MPVEHMKETLYREAELETSALLSSSGMLSGSSGICPRTYRQKKQQDGWKNSNEKMSRAFPSVASTSILNQM